MKWSCGCQSGSGEGGGGFSGGDGVKNFLGWEILASIILVVSFYQGFFGYSKNGKICGNNLLWYLRIPKVMVP